MKNFRIFLCLLANAFVLGLLLLVYLDGRNPYMSFLTSQSSKIYLIALCAVCLLISCLSIADLRRRKR